VEYCVTIRLSRFLTDDVKSSVAYLHGVSMVSFADVSDVYAAFLFIRCKYS
jgi:hypothetical protein